MAYKVTINFTNGETDELDEVFSTKREAMAAFQSYCCDYSTGAAIFASRADEEGDLYDEPEIVDCTIEKV